MNGSHARCSLCGTIAPLYHGDVAAFAVCRRCFSATGRQPSLSSLQTLELEKVVQADSKVVNSGQWLPWPKFIAESPASGSASTLSIITSAIKTWADTGKLPADLRLVDLCHVSSECVPWLTAKTIAALCQMLLKLAKTPQEIHASRSFLHRVLCALAKHAQPCHGSDYVGLASELQLIGLAHGDLALRRRAEAFAATFRDTGDVASAAEVLWVFLTAKAVEMPLLEALETLKLDGHEGHQNQISHEISNSDAVAAILCGLAQPCVMSALHLNQLTRLAEYFARFLLSQEATFPVQTFPRLALALSDLLKHLKHGGWGPNNSQISQALELVLQKALEIHIFTVEELSDLAVAATACSCSRRSLEIRHRFLQLVEDLLERPPKIQKPRLVPGAAVKLRKAVGVVPANSQGLLGEFYLARGQWRVWLEDLEGCDRWVDVMEDHLELLDGGLRPKSCCHRCWRLSEELSDPQRSVSYLVHLDTFGTFKPPWLRSWVFML